LADHAAALCDSDTLSMPARVKAVGREAFEAILGPVKDRLAGKDGFLHMDEIASLKLNADLVVLSACRTGQGTMARGEGVTGLARAFLYAGSKGVVCSLWSVDDRETANLMVDFYGHLKEGRPAADALRDAQLAMIRAGKAPLYWAPFIVIGE
jgi:CHAT domain-containing protein